MYLLEDGIELWHVLLRSAPAPHEGFRALMQTYFPALAQIGSENLETVISIFKSNLLLDPHAMLPVRQRDFCFLWDPVVTPV